MLTTGNGKLGIYVHIPFCLSKCAYCDFYSFVPGDEEIFERYTAALCDHMKYYRDAAKERTVDTVYIGGGTPTVMPVKMLCRILDAVKRNFRVAKGAEVTVEVNPATADKRTFSRLRRHGVNRISIGFQSADSGELKALSRIHSREEFEECFAAARAAKIDNISVDLMFGIPLQTEESLCRSIDYLTRLRPEHISLYDLKIEPGTAFAKVRETLALPDEDTEYSMYRKAAALLERRGYMQYEISNFARDGRVSRHNMRYWNCEEYLGFGPAAHSFFNNSRYSFVRNIERYIKGVEDISNAAGITENLEEISGRAGMGEYIMLGLRLTRGISYREFYMRFGCDFREMYGEKLGFYLKNGYMRETRDGVALTLSGMFVSNYILSDILSFEDLNVISPAGRF